MSSPVRSRYQDLQLTKENALRIKQDIKKILLTGHFNGSYSLASVNRHILNRCLLDEPNIEWRIQPYEGEVAPKVSVTPKGKEEVQRLNQYLQKNDSDGVDRVNGVSIYHHYPLISPNKEDETSIALFFWGRIKSGPNHY